MSSLVELMGGNETFVNRTEHYFTKGYYLAGNEPSFAMPFAYNYAGRPDLTALRVRNVVFENFNTGIGGVRVCNYVYKSLAADSILKIPGNDDSGAMAALLVFHILGLYPVPASAQLLVGSPLLSSYTLHNELLDTSTTVTVSGFDPNSVVQTPGDGVRLYVT